MSRVIELLAEFDVSKLQVKPEDDKHQGEIKRATAIKALIDSITRTSFHKDSQATPQETVLKATNNLRTIKEYAEKSPQNSTLRRLTAHLEQCVKNTKPIPPPRNTSSKSLTDPVQTPEPVLRRVHSMQIVSEAGSSSTLFFDSPPPRPPRTPKELKGSATLKSPPIRPPRTSQSLQENLSGEQKLLENLKATCIDISAKLSEEDIFARREKLNALVETLRECAQQISFIKDCMNYNSTDDIRAKLQSQGIPTEALAARAFALSNLLSDISMDFIEISNHDVGETEMLYQKGLLEIVTLRNALDIVLCLHCSEFLVTDAFYQHNILSLSDNKKTQNRIRWAIIPYLFKDYFEPKMFEELMSLPMDLTGTEPTAKEDASLNPQMFYKAYICNSSFVHNIKSSIAKIYSPIMRFSQSQEKLENPVYESCHIKKTDEEILKLYVPEKIKDILKILRKLSLPENNDFESATKLLTQIQDIAKTEVKKPESSAQIPSEEKGINSLFFAVKKGLTELTTQKPMTEKELYENILETVDNLLLEHSKSESTSSHNPENGYPSPS